MRISRSLINETIDHFQTYQHEEFVVSPSLPILYFGDLEEYEKSFLKILTVGKNPSDNEFCLHKKDHYSFCRFTKWDSNSLNLVETLNPYFSNKPLKSWFSSFEPILNGIGCSFYEDKENYENRALHTDICSPLATNPTWSKLTQSQKSKLYSGGFLIWKKLIEELQPDIMLISIPKKLFQKVITSDGYELISFDCKKDGSKRKNAYKVYIHDHELKSGKQVKVVFGQAANKPFGTISQEQKREIGRTIRLKQ